MRKYFWFDLRIPFAVLLVNISSVNSVYADSSFDTGTHYFRLRKYAQAAQAFEKSIKDTSPNPAKRYYLGLCYYYKGQRTKATKEFEKLVQEFPESAAAKRAKVFLNKLGASKFSKSNSSPRASNLVMEGTFPRFCRVRYKEVDEDIVVDTKVNERPIKMIFDTGAPDTWIGTNHLHSLGIKLPTGPFKRMKSQLGEDKMYRYWKMNIDLKVGDIVRKNFPVLVQENRKGMPLIGQTFVSGYQFKIDHSSNELCFTKKTDSKSAYRHQIKQASNEVKFEVENASYIKVTAKVNGKPCKMVFDTGASTVYFPESYVSKYGITIPPNSKTHTYKAAKPTRTGMVSRIQLGPIDSRNVEVVLADWSNMDEPLLGVSFYKGWEYTIDRERKVIKFLRR